MFVLWRLKFSLWPALFKKAFGTVKKEDIHNSPQLDGPTSPCFGSLRVWFFSKEKNVKKSPIPSQWSAKEKRTNGTIRLSKNPTLRSWIIWWIPESRMISLFWRHHFHYWDQRIEMFPHSVLWSCWFPSYSQISSTFFKIKQKAILVYKVHLAVGGR